MKKTNATTVDEGDLGKVALVPFTTFKQAIQRRFNEIKELPAYRSSVDRDALWNLYLASFPKGTNPTFRERTEHDCSSCRSFVKNVGPLVTIIDGELATIWDIQVGGQYQPVVDALAKFVKAHAIENIYLHGEHPVSTDKNFEDIAGDVRTWEHLHVVLPSALTAKNDQIGPKESEARSSHDVMLRALKEISIDSVEQVQDLISQNSLYRGEEKKRLVDEFARLKRIFDQLPETQRDLFAWTQVTTNAWICRVRNDVIGTLMVDLSEGVPIEQAVKSFEDKVSGTNYQRPTALVTPKMRDAARATIEELGLALSLERRFARLEDISINNVLFADRNAKTRMAGDVFDDIPTKGKDVKQYDKVEEITIDKFISDVLPTAGSIEVLMETKHAGNLVSLVAPYDLTAKPLFKWSNPFSWSYNGDVADSIKQRVKAAGGSVVGDLCCRLAWYNCDDLDLHMQEPRDHIFYGHRRGASGGQLDVDMNAGGCTTRTPVENIFYGRTPPEGEYTLFVHQYCRRDSTSDGFDVEIDVLGTVHSFTFAGPLSTGRRVDVASIVVSADGMKVKPILPASQMQKEMWGIKTQDFHRVTAIMLSPNHWDGEGVGNKHFFFMLDGCQNDGSARGFYNEFLHSSLEPHRRTMELVGSRMRTEESGDQMSGLGFSSTQRNSVVVRVAGSFQRTLKVTF